MFDLILENGTLISPTSRTQASIGVKDGRITTISADLSAAPSHNRLDLHNQFILPGCIDAHMHLWENGFRANPDFTDSTRAALAGGVTTIIDHPLSPPETLDAQSFQAKVQLGERTSCTDFALHAGVSPTNLEQLPALWQAGCTAFKIFMSDSFTALGRLDNDALRAAFETIGRLGATAIIHAENEDMLQANLRRLQAMQRNDPLAFTAWRPPEVEIEAIRQALSLLKGTGCRANFLHTTYLKASK